MLGAGLEEGKMLGKGRRASRVRQRKMLGGGAGLGGREDAGKGEESKQSKAKEDAGRWSRVGGREDAGKGKESKQSKARKILGGQDWREGKMLEKGRRASRLRQRKMLWWVRAGEREDDGKGEESKQTKAKEDAGGRAGEREDAGKGRRASRVRQRKMLEGGAGLEGREDAGKGKESKGRF
jgi:hypothetical protein